MYKIFTATTFALAFLFFSQSGKANTLNFSNPQYFLGSDEPEIFVDGGMLACPGETIRVSLRVKHFSDIISFQYTLNWDPDQLEFQERLDVPADFSTQVDTFEVDHGMYNTNWFDPSGAGVSLGNSSTLMTLVFKVVGGNGTSSLFFSDLPTKLEVSQLVNGAPAKVNAVSLDGDIMISSPMVTDVEVIGETAMEGNGSIDITVGSGVGPYTFLWSNDETTEDISNLEVGDYYVTITDSRQCEVVSGPHTVEMTSAINRIASLASLNIFPNPAVNRFQIQATFNQIEDIQVRLHNLTGQLMYSSFTSGSVLTENIDVNDLPAGIYLLELIGQDGILTEKVVIRK